MVKNEEQVLIPTLLPFFDAGIRHFLVLDTGSTDNTVQQAKTFFVEHPTIMGYIFQEPFIDFSSSRNHALHLAAACFPDAHFFFMTDAEWYIHHAEQLLNFCAQEINTTTRTYLVRIELGSQSHYQARLLRAHKNVHFIGKVHEVLDGVPGVKIPDPLYIHFNASAKGLAKSKQRWLNDRKILIHDYLRNPADTRTLFYLAQTYLCLEEWQQALKYYIIRSCMKGWSEENYVACYKAALIFQYIFNNWPCALEYYEKALMCSPNRAEPLVQMARYYISHNNFIKAYRYVHQACTLPYPKDILFIEKPLYISERYILLDSIIDVMVDRITSGSGSKIFKN